MFKTCILGFIPCPMGQHLSSVPINEQMEFGPHFIFFISNLVQRFILNKKHVMVNKCSSKIILRVNQNSPINNLPIDERLIHFALLNYQEYCTLYPRLPTPRHYTICKSLYIHHHQDMIFNMFLFNIITCHDLF